MELEITENIIRGSIIYSLKEAFGDTYKYYDEEIEQGFKKPSFYVQRVGNSSRKGYTGHQYELRDDLYEYSIIYFTDKDYGRIKDINDKIDKLKDIFKYLNIINIVDGKVYSKPNRINNINVMVSDKVLTFDIQFPIRTVQYLEVDKVKTNTLEQHIINKEKEE